MAAARQAYDALPVADRRAIQDNMVWAGVYKGVVDGEFGRMTFNAMRSFTARRAGAAEGILSAPDRAALAAEAAKARAAMDFRLVQEPRAGVSIGIPQRVFTRRQESGFGARFESADKAATVETFRMKEGDATLPSLYESYRANVPGRRVTYSVIRPDFLVVAAETAQRATYTRVVRGQAGGESILRGFTVSWPKTQQARFEMLSVAISNSFDPFGLKPAVAAVGQSGQQAGPGAAGSAGAPPVAAPKPLLASTAIAFAPNRYIAVLPGGVCNAARIGTRTARLLRADPATGLALFDVPGGAGIRLRTPPLKAESGEPAVVLFAGEGDGAPAVSAGAGEIAEIVDASKPLRLRAPVPAESAGGVVVSRKGDLLGIVAPLPPQPRKLSGAPPPASRPLIPAAALGEFLASTGLEFVPQQQDQAQPVSAGKIAADNKGSIDGLWCLPSPAPPR